MTNLIEWRRPKDRFARSVNVERDSGAEAVQGYLPVGRAIETVDRLLTAINAKNGEVAFSVTGPYGSGKSSLALLIDSILGPESDPAHEASVELLASVAEDLLPKLEQARSVTPQGSGFIRAVVTAQLEPATTTVVRALLHGIGRFGGKSSILRNCEAQLRTVLEDLQAGRSKTDARTIRAIIRKMREVAPVLILIDEFGKNLEAFAEAPGDGDLFLLQDLAEESRTGQPHRLAVVTLQHMAFAEYAEGASGQQRREWVKVQGRFEDVPFVDTPEQTRSLVAAAFSSSDSGEFRRRLGEWLAEELRSVAELALADVVGDGDQVQACWPLHPTALAVIPDLCQRYGQNERTMFSFLASSEPLSVASFLAQTKRPTRGERLPSIRLDRLYDYFIESASTMVSVSADASRWIEIDTRIRDASGQSDACIRVLKCVGLLNLVSSGGSLRASRQMLHYACADGQWGTEDLAAVEDRLKELDGAGLITYRDFADEYRVWQGSDFDLKNVIALTRRRLRDIPDQDIVRAVLPLDPIVAARHSHSTGTLRTFARVWSDHLGSNLSPLTGRDKSDGLIAYVLGSVAPTGASGASRNTKPIVFATTTDSGALIDAAREVLAIQEILRTDETVHADWVVKRELGERQVAAQSRLRVEFENAFGAGAATFTWLAPAGGTRSGKWTQHEAASASAVASTVADSYYCEAIPFHNELINRHELSSQAAKARREVAERMAAFGDHEELGLSGHGPDRTLYLSLFEAFDLHGESDSGTGFHDPGVRSGASKTWKALLRSLRAATTERLNVANLYETLALPPYGLREGPAPLLLIAALVAHADEFALYEHGTFKPTPTADVCERLLRNPHNFEVKCYAASSGARAELVREAASVLGVATRSGAALGVVSVVGRLVSLIANLHDYAKRTNVLSAEAIRLRAAALQATEPDVLLFADVPTSLGLPSVGPDAPASDVLSIAEGLRVVLEDLQSAYPKLLASIRESLIEHLRPEHPGDLQSNLLQRSSAIKDKVIDPRVRSLVAALQAEMDEDEWLSYVGMQVAGGPPAGWTDDDRRRFEVLIQDVGAAFLRVEALTADVRAAGGDFDAIRIAINSSSGSDMVRLLTLDPKRLSVVDQYVDETLSQLSGTGHEEREILDWILASVLNRQLSAAETDSVGTGAYRQGQGESLREEGTA
jgi:hypothetical protein